jgi:predicted Zn-dependent protease
MFLALGVVVWCGACASHLPPLGAASQSAALEPDEAWLWEQAAREHHRLSASGSVLRDPVLDDYLSSVASRLLPPDLAGGGVAVSVQVLANPSLNAFALPNGAIYVHSGLLAQLENEAQLAMVLAHELGHIVHRHAIRYLREERNKDLWRRIAFVATPLVLGPLLAPLGISVSGGANPAVLFQRPSVEDLLHDEALDTAYALSNRPTGSRRFDAATALYTRAQPPLALSASVRRYNAALAEEADRFAVEAMARAGYDPHEAARTLAHLQDAVRGQAAQEPFWWGQPTAYEARALWVAQAIASLPPETVAALPPPPADDGYQQRTRLLVRENARVALKAGRVEEAIAQLQRALRLHPQDATAHFYLGQAYAAQASTPEELQRAAEAYRQATSLDSRLAEAYRELAAIYTKLGEVERATAAQDTYSTLRREAIDRLSSTLRTRLNQAPAASPPPWLSAPAATPRR